MTFSNGVVSTYTYDVASRLTGLQHRRNPGNVLVAGYTATYDNAGRVTQVAEAHTGASTAFTYDAAGRLLAENRTGASPYQSAYTYNPRGQRATALRSEAGTPSHDGVYAYDAAGRLTSVADAVAASGLGGTYAWNADGTLASYPGPGYRRALEYDEEGRVTRITRDFAANPDVVAFEYGYGFDGARRFSRDLSAGVQRWFPCGVACGAGELVEMTAPLSGGSWTTAATLLEGPAGIVARNGEFVLPSITGGAVATTNASGIPIATVIADGMGVSRSSTGVSMLLPSSSGDEGTAGHLARLGRPLGPNWEPVPGEPGFKKCPNGLILPINVPCPPVKPPGRGRGLVGRIKGIGKIVGGIATGGANALCALAIASIADDVQNAPGPPDCASLCEALRIWRDTLRNGGSGVQGIANLVGCEAAIWAIERGCQC